MEALQTESVEQVGREALGRTQDREPVAVELPVISPEVPHYTSFAHITDPRIRRAKEYEQYLQFALERFPEYTARINDEICWAQAEGKRDKPSDRDRIFTSVELEALTRFEIAEDTGIPVSTVYVHLQDLIGLGLVKAEKVAGRGVKCQILYSQTHTGP